MPILTDCHNHTPLCQHAIGPLEAYVERAIELDLQTIGFSDHNPLPDGRGANVRMKESEFDYYVQRILDLRYQYRGKIEILLGLEMDYVAGLEDYLVKQIARYPFDYIIGSVHYLDPDCRFGAFTQDCPLPVDEQYTQYFAALRKLAHAGLCDIIAHFDVVKRSCRQPSARALAEIPATLAEIARAGICMEINTSGYRHSELTEPQPYPTLPVVEQALALGIPVMVNSDAHAPNQVGLKFPEMEHWLRQHGCRQLGRYDNRQRSFYTL